MDKPSLIIMVGLPASGKSTYAQRLAFETGAILLSSDDIRKELLGSEADQSNNGLVFQVLYERAKGYLLSGISVIIDSTNINMKERRKALSNFSRMNINRYCVVMATPFEICVELDKARERTVGEEVIKKFLYRFEIPMEFEGFDKIQVEGTSDTKILSALEEMRNFDQKNPYHKFTLDKHCIECCRHLSKITDDIELIQAGKLHDIGKLYTQTIDSDGVAHYYSHQNVGAYIMASAGYYTPEQIFYVNHHMAPFQWKEEKTKEKYKKLFGEYLYNNLVLLHVCDKLASDKEA